MTSFSRTLRPIFFTLSLLFFSFVSVCAQQSTDGTTPLALSPGAPTGSYTLSDFEDVNLFNGTLNFSLPFAKIDGRGDAGYPLTLRIDHKWMVQKEQSENQPPINIYTPQPGWWTDMGWAPIYSMGRMEMRQGGSRDYVISSPCGYIHRVTLTRLTFTAPDGTEYELRDQVTNGQPVLATCTGYNRGTVFVTADGTAATFISDTNISDYPFDNPADYPPSGYMMLRDGSRYRVDGGKVMWMRDANGNKLTFVYDIWQRMTSVSDSLNRQVTISYNSGSGTYDLINFKGFGGATRTLKVYFSALSTVLRSDFTFLTTGQMFPELNGAGNGYYNPAVVSAVELPNGQQYQFRYNSYSELSRIILPTGGAIEYDYAAGLTDSATGSGIISGNAIKHIYRRVIERRVYPDGGSGTGFASRMTYSRPETTTTNAGYVTTDQYNAGGTLLTRAIHYFNGSARASFSKQPTDYPVWTDGREYKTETFASNGTTLLRKVEHTFQQRAAVSWWTGGASTAPPNDVRIAETVTTLADTNQISKQMFGYDDTVAFNNQNNLKEYDFGSGVVGPLLRETRTTYLTGSTYTGTGVHIRNLPTQVSIYDSGSTERARTTFEYDNYAADANHAALINRASISGFDSAFTTSYATRGNVTGTTRYLLSGGSVTGSISSYSQYDIAGNAVKTIDALGYVTEIYFTDCFGAPNGEARTNSAPTELSGVSSYAFITSVKNHLNQWAYSQFDFYLGEPVDGEDANGVVASGTYNDSLDRPTQIRRAAGTVITNQTTFGYDDVNHLIYTSRDRDANNDNILSSLVQYDHMGRTIETRQYEGGTNYIATQMQYDVLGRLYKTSNSFRPWLGETPVWATTAFDTLERTTSITLPDNAVTLTSYSGNSITVTDPALKKKKSVSDALGRLREVYEDPNGLNYLTSYTYDVLDGLTTVTQGTQTRTFAFDSLKRLTSATNPENGTISYQYDNNANLSVKTDARNVSTHLSYDGLNRLTRRWYNGSNLTSATTHNSPALPAGVGVSSEANFYYDSQSLPSGAPTFSRGSSIGRQVAITYGTGSSSGDYFGYDALGRISLKIQQTGGVNYQTSAAYNLAGDITGLTYPSGHTSTYSYDNAGRTTNFSGNLGDGTTRTYASTFVYNAAGQITQELFGTATPLYHKLQYNIRSQLWDVRVSTGSDINGSSNRGGLQYFYEGALGYGTSGPDNNGDLLFANTYYNDDPNNVWAISRQRYAYDSLNRLTSTTEYFISNSQSESQQSVQSYTYDRWGNRTINAAGTNGTAINNKVFTVNTANNQLGVPVGQSGAMGYDTAGNLTNDTYSGAGNRTYDAENKITSAWGGNNQAQLYTYDAGGQRIKRAVDGVQTWQIYGIEGELLAEYAASGAAGSPQKEYGYRNDELLITASPGGGGNSTQNATWNNVVGVSANGNSLTKTGTGDVWNSGASSNQAITSGDGYVEFTATELSSYRMIALSNGDANQSYEELDFAFYLGMNGYLFIYENNANVNWPGFYATGDTMRISIESGVVKYRKNGTVVYTSTATPTYPLRVDTSFYTASSSVSNVVISGNMGSGGSVRWLVPDQLGTPRIILDQTGSLAGVKRHDYLPFGEELFAGTGGRTAALGYTTGDGVRQQFTKKERDVETGLDYFEARYYSSIQARFTSPDEFSGGPDEFYEFHDLASQNPTFYADLTDPQSLNKYQYGYNNPLLYIDPDGHQNVRERFRSAVNTTLDFMTGVARGALSSISNGVVGAPRPDDSLVNRAGQGAGTIAVAYGGYVTASSGAGLTIVSAGAAAEVSLPMAAAGVSVMVLATGNAIRIATTPMQRNSTPSRSSNERPKPVEGSSGGPGAGKRPSEATKAEIRTRDNNRCVYCGRKTTRSAGPRQSNIDHSTPRSRNGNISKKNLQNTCRSCNQKKGPKTNREFLDK